MSQIAYRIRPNYHSLHLGFSKLLGKLVVKYVSTYTKGTLKKKKKKRDQKKICLMMLMRFFSYFLYKSICWGTHLNYIDKSNSNGYPQHMPLYRSRKKYTGYNLKTTELLDCVLIGVCAVISQIRKLEVFAKKTVPRFVLSGFIEV